MTDWTPGPWRMIRDDTGGEYTGWPSVEGPEEADTSIVHRAGFHHEFWDWHPGMPEAIANARLIAAAPDLYEALETIVADAESGQCEEDALELARTALSKARGETQ